jgi:hypothetical protein
MNTATGTRPSILHASGNISMHELGLRLDYDQSTLVPENNMINFTKKAFSHIGQIFKS